MNKCVICGKECTGQCCSGACRARLSRRTRTNGERTVKAHAILEQPSEEDFTTDYCIIDGIKRPLNYGQEDCTCQHCKGVRMNGLKLTLNHGQHKSAGELAEGERNRVALPGDVDYAG